MSTLGISSSRSKLFTPTHLTFTPHADVTIIFTKLTRLNFLAWTPNCFHWIYWEIRRCASCGDVRPLIFRYLTRRRHQPGNNRLCTLQNATSTNGDYVHCRTPLSQTATMLTSWPPTFLLSTSSHPMTWSVQLVFIKLYFHYLY